MLRGDDERPVGIATVAGLGVALVAIARFLAAEHPTFPAHLGAVLASAEQAGLESTDLELLRTMVRSFVGESLTR